MINTHRNNVFSIASHLAVTPEEYTYKQYCAVTNLLENNKIELSERSFLGRLLGAGFEHDNLLARLNNLDSSLRLTHPTLVEPLWDVYASGGCSLRDVRISNSLLDRLQQINTEKPNNFVAQAKIKIKEALKLPPPGVYNKQGKARKVEEVITDLANKSDVIIP
ncbi:MAG: hypothetical protein WCK42_01675 [Myxococcaceae bacterium]